MKSKTKKLLIIPALACASFAYGYFFTKTTLRYENQEHKYTRKEIQQIEAINKDFNPEERHGYDFKEWDIKNADNLFFQILPIKKACVIEPIYERHAFKTNLIVNQDQVFSYKNVLYKEPIGEFTVPDKEFHKFSHFEDMETKETINFDTPSTKDRNVIAVYKPMEFKIVYDTNGGTMTQQDITSYTYGEKTKLPVASMSGYNFAGWTDQDGNNYWELGEKVHGDLKLKANFTPDIFTSHPDEGPEGRLFVPAVGYTAKIFPRADDDHQSQVLTDLPDSCVDLHRGFNVPHLIADHSHQGFGKALTHGIGTDVVVVQNGERHNYKIRKFTTGQNTGHDIILDSGEILSDWSEGLPYVMYTCAKPGTSVPVYVVAAG